MEHWRGLRGSQLHQQPCSRTRAALAYQMRGTDQLMVETRKLPIVVKGGTRKRQVALAHGLGGRAVRKGRVGEWEDPFWSTFTLGKRSGRVRLPFLVVPNG